MKTTIKNKQTGETLTGEIILGGEWLSFQIAGTKTNPNRFDASEWDILPPPLPTGIGAVVKNCHAVKYLRTHRKESPWLCIDGDSSLGDELLAVSGPFTILSEGVTL